MKKLDKILKKNNSPLQNLYRKLAVFNQYTEIVRGYLDADIARQVTVVGEKRGTWILHVSNSALATKLTYQTQAIMRAIRFDYPDVPIKSIKVKVAANQTRPNQDLRPKRQIKSLSEENAEHIASTAEYVSDPKLQEVMKQLAKRVK